MGLLSVVIGWLTSPQREMVQNALNALDLFADTGDLFDARKLKSNMHLQGVVPVMQDWLRAGGLHPYTVQ
jgi:hypothetical protein